MFFIKNINAINYEAYNISIEKCFFYFKIFFWFMSSFSDFLRYLLNITYWTLSHAASLILTENFFKT